MFLSSLGVVGSRKQLAPAAFALFAAGAISSDNSNETIKYGFVSNSVSPGSDLSIARTQRAGAGTDEFGLIAGGFSPLSNVVDKYTYGSETVSANYSLADSIRSFSGCGNRELAVFTGGNDGGISYSIRRYVYAAASVINGLSLQSPRTTHVSASDMGIALIAGTTGNFSSTERYMLNNSSLTVGTALSHAGGDKAAMNNDQYAYFAGGYYSGYTNKVDKFSFSAASKTVSNTLPATRGYCSGASTPTTGVIAGGVVGGSFVATTVVYPFATEARIAGTSLSKADYTLTGLSSTPGHF